MDKNIMLRANMEAFKKKRSDLLEAYAGEYALMRDKEWVGCFKRPADAHRYAHETFRDKNYSLHKVSDEVLSFGYHSAVN